MNRHPTALDPRRVLPDGEQAATQQTRMNTMERRFLETEVRMQADDSGRWIVGYAVKWETLSLPLWIDQRTGKPVRE